LDFQTRDRGELNPTRVALRPKRALIVTDRGLLMPSGMVRALQYKPLFDRCVEWHAEFTSRRSEWLFRLRYDNALRSRIPRRILGRLGYRYIDYWEQHRENEIVKRARSADIVSIVKSPGDRLYRRLLKLGRPRVVMDLNDAVWLPSYHWTGIGTLLKDVHGVICENEYVASYVRRFNPRVAIVPDSPQIEVFDRFRDTIRRDPNKIVLGWIGGAETIGHLYRIFEPLEALFRGPPQLHLRVVGAEESMLPRFEQVRWSCCPSFDQEQMAREVLRFDIGLFPLFHTEDARGRGTLKAMVYMSGGAVAVCERYGENPKLIEDGVNGLLASSPEEWYEKLEGVISDSHKRLRIASQGIRTVRNAFTAEHVFSKLVRALEQFLG